MDSVFKNIREQAEKHQKNKKIKRFPRLINNHKMQSDNS